MGYALQHHRETKNEVNVSQECILHSWEAKETESVTEGIRSKPKVHSSEFYRERTDIAHEIPFFYLCGAPVGESHNVH